MWEILGISPTTDIKEIKSAYARLAKQFNPEEKPEEFKRIFDAYKAACAYAKRMGKISPGKEHREQEENDIEFISREEYRTMTDGDEKKDTSAGGVSQGYDFSTVGDGKNTDPKESTQKEEFDFGSVNMNRSGIDGDDRTSSLRIDLIRRLKKIFDSRREADINTWRSFFYDTYFDELVFDTDFRLQAREIFLHRHLPHLTAKLVAECFGEGTRYVCEGYDRYTVIISDGRYVNGMYAQRVTPRKQFQNKKKKEELLQKIIVTAVAAVIFGFPMISYFVGPPDSASSYSHTEETTTSPVVITLPPYKEGDDIGEYIFKAAVAVAEEKSYDEDFLYESCPGKWVFDFGYVYLDENREAEITFNGKIFSGTVTAVAAPKGAVLDMVFHCENEEADGMKLTAHIISHEGKHMVCTDRDGNEYTGVYEQKKEEAET